MSDDPAKFPSGRAAPDTRAEIGRLLAVVLAVVAAAALIGFVVGLADGVPSDGRSAGFRSLAEMADRGRTDRGSHGGGRHRDGPGGALLDPGFGEPIEAVDYSALPQVTRRTTPDGSARPVRLPRAATGAAAAPPPAPSEADKLRSLQIRASRRAFNGAPPVIPHAVLGTSDAACYACHARGMRMQGAKASAMSHGFLANCTQCHAPPAPQPLAPFHRRAESTFVGLPAPAAGQRAFPGAPPTIPHSTWMREKCGACHEAPVGWNGLQSTHPWRINCTQCHTPSAVLEQAVTAVEVPMLPPLAAEKP